MFEEKNYCPSTNTTQCSEPVTPQTVEIDSCTDFISTSLDDLTPVSQGRIISLNVKLKNVCPQKRTAVAVMLTELDQNNVEYNRGLKTILVDAHSRPSCNDIQLECIYFAVPEELSLAEDCDGSGTTCSERHFRVRAFAHYVDITFDED